MELIAFHHRFPKIGKDECRSLVLPTGGDSIPPGIYAFVEHYCADKACDCRRVMLVVTDTKTGERLASISYGFDRKAPLSGPFLDPLYRQSCHSQEFLELAKEVLLSDGRYVARLHKHYRMIKVVHRGELVLTEAAFSPEEVQERIAERKAKRREFQRFGHRKASAARIAGANARGGRRSG